MVAASQRDRGAVRYREDRASVTEITEQFVTEPQRFSFCLTPLPAGGGGPRPPPTAALVAARRVSLRRPGDIVGLRVVVDRVNSIAHVALLKWLKRNGLSDKDIRLSYLAFPDVLSALLRGVVDVGFLPEPLLTQAKQRGLRPVAYPVNAICPRDCLTTMWMARRDVDPNLAARFRNAIQAAAIWANQERNNAASGAILAKYAHIDGPVIRRMTRTSFAKRLRPVEGQPWLDVFAEFGLIPAAFPAIELVK
jgi:NitT/TauT family transport system substrate-binding protein